MGFRYTITKLALYKAVGQQIIASAEVMKMVTIKLEAA